MSFNGSGSFSFTASSVRPAVFDTTISEVDFNALMAELETGLSTVICRDGQSTTTAVIPFAQGVQTDTVAERSSNAGVTVDGMLIKDGGVADDFRFAGVISPAEIASDQDDYDPSGLSTATVLRLSTDASRSITSLAGGAPGRIIIIHNVGSFPIVLTDDDSATGTAANRFALFADVTLDADQCVILQYDATSSRWRALAGPAAAASATVAGIVELATTAETETGTDTTRAVTPDGLHDMTTLAGAAWFLDEDDMASDSAVKVASQQSVKAYVDAETAINEGTKQATTSGTAFDFTGIPAGTKRITVIFNGVSLSGTDHILVQIGDAGGIETTGYDSSATHYSTGSTGSTTNTTAGFILIAGVAAASISGVMTLVCSDAANFEWTEGHTKGDSGSSLGGMGGGRKALSAELTQVRITRTGTDTFDAGAVNILYE